MKSSESWLMKNSVMLVHLGTFLTIIIPLLYPIGLPLTISNESILYYEIIESFPPGSIILVDVAGLGPGAWGEVGYGAIANIKHLMSNELNFIILSSNVAATANIERIL